MNCTHALRNLSLTLILATRAFSAPAGAQIRLQEAKRAKKQK